LIRSNSLDETDSSVIRDHIERAEEHVLRSRFAITEAQKLICSADKLIHRK
jgi:hypothetical protein